MKKILIVDDEAYVRELVKATLSASNYMVFTAMDGEEALEVAKKEMPDLMLLDIEMPKKDGYEVCRQLKSDSKTSHIHIIMLTAYGQKKNMEKGREVGANDYFVKPFSPTALLDKINEVLG